MDKYHHEMQLDKHLYLGKFLKNKYNDLLIADTLRLLALSMISLFVPIFLLETGYSIFSIALFELGMFVAIVPMHYYSLKYLNKFGVKWMMIISYFISILFYFLLFYNLSVISLIGNNLFLVAIGAVNVTAMALYWTSHHLYFINSVDRKEAGSRLAIITAIPSLAAISSPFIGSLLITNFSYELSFLVSIVFLVLGSIILLYSDKIGFTEVKLDIKKIIDFKSDKKNIIFIIQGIGYAATGLIWPILLFYLSVKLTFMGILYLFSNIGYALIGYIGGRTSDRNGSHSVVRIGAIGHGASMILRSFAVTIVALTAFQTMGGIFGGLLHISLNAGFFRWSREDAANRIMNREVYMHIGRFFIIGLFAILIFYFEVITSLVIALIVSGISTFLLSLFISKETIIVD